MLYIIRSKKICTQILIDTGASGYAFISDSFAQTHNLSLTPLAAPIVLENFDGRPVVSGNLTHKTTLDKIIGPYAYRLSLPPDSNAHPVFHVNKLRLAPDDPLPGQRLTPPPPLRVSNITDEWEYEVDEILDSRLFSRWKHLKYLVQFRGEEASWQPADNLTNCDRLLADFHSRYPDKPGPETLNS